MKVFRDDRPGRGYDFEETVHSRRGLQVFNDVQSWLGDMPEDFSPFLAMGVLFNAACTRYEAHTNDKLAAEFAGGIRIAVWSRACQIGCSDAEAKEVTEEVFATMYQAAFAVARGDKPYAVLDLPERSCLPQWFDDRLCAAEAAAEASLASEGAE